MMKFNTRIGKFGVSLVLAIVLIVLLVAAAPMATRYIFGGLVIEGTGDQTQLRVTGWTTQTSDLFVVEQSDGTDVLTVTNAGALSYSGASSFNGDTTIAGKLLVDGQADAVQLTAQGYTTQTNNLLTLEQSDGTDVLGVTNSGNITVVGSVLNSAGAFTITDNAMVDGQADVVQMIVQGNATQTSNPFVIEQSDGTDIFTVTNAGALGIASNLTVAGPADFNYVQGIDAGAAGDSLEVAFTSPVDTAGTNTHNAFVVDLAIGNATAGTNSVRGLQIDGITGDADVTETAINVEGGWDAGLTVASPVGFTYVQGIDAGAAGDSLEVAFTSPVDTAGTNTHNAVTVDLAIGNATAGTNNVRGLQIDSITGDAQVIETAVNVDAGWDVGLAVDAPADFTYVQGIDAGAAGDSLEVAFTSPVDTAGANTHNAVTVDLAIGDSTAGTNNVAAIQIDAIVDDAQVVETAINIGDEWDVAIDANVPIVASAMQWFDDFIGSTVMAMYTEVSGSDAEAVQTIVEEQFGVYQITSGDVGSGVAADLEAVYLSLEWQADQGSLIYETRLHLDTDVATVELCAGFTDDVATVELPFTNSADTVTAVADDAVMFCFDTNATTDEWWVNGANAGTEATGIAATGVVPAADIYQTLRIEVDDGGEDCRFYINGALVGTLTANCVTNTDLLAPGVVISSGGAAVSNVVDVDYILVGAARD